MLFQPGCTYETKNITKTFLGAMKADSADFEPVTVTADGRELRCALCHNLGQARRAIEAGGFDVIRAIS